MPYNLGSYCRPDVGTRAQLEGKRFYGPPPAKAQDKTWAKTENHPLEKNTGGAWNRTWNLLVSRQQRYNSVRRTHLICFHRTGRLINIIV